MLMGRVRLFAMVVLPFVVLTLVPFGYGQGSTSSAARVVSAVNESDLIQLSGSTHPLAITQYDQGSVADDLAMNHVFLVLRRSPEQERALERLSEQMHDPHSAYYHKWLTADELGRRFGPAREDIDAVVGWLTSHGLRVNSIHRTGLTIDVSGTAGQVQDAFHTEIHRYNVKGKQHIANASDRGSPQHLHQWWRVSHRYMISCRSL